MDTLEEKLDIRATRKAVQKHLNWLKKRIFKTDILDYISISSSVVGSDRSPSLLTPNSKLVKASNKSKAYNEEISRYLEWILTGINQLEPEQKKFILGKYLYDYDQEEFEEATNFTIRTIYRKIKEGEIDLAIILGCDVYKKK